MPSGANRAKWHGETRCERQPGRTGIGGRIVNPAALIGRYAFYRATRLPTGADPG